MNVIPIILKISLVLVVLILFAGCTQTGKPNENPSQTTVSAKITDPGGISQITQTTVSAKNTDSGGISQDTLTISPKGQALAQFIDSMDVEKHWLSGTKGINWETGDPDPNRPVYSTTVTHCSNFVAAASLRLKVYLLRPPEHDQDNLVNAQNDWLNSQSGKDAGWTKLPDAISAQYYANQGDFVVSSTKGTDPNSNTYETMFGHIAVVRPSSKSHAAILVSGPQVAEAGWINSPNVSVKAGYASIPGAWVGDGNGAVEFFMHPIPDKALEVFYPKTQ